jgi:hypothetical protein
VRWVDPRVVVLVVAFPLLLVAVLTPADSYALLYRTEKHIGLPFLVIGLYGYCALFAGMLIPDRQHPDSEPQLQAMLHYARRAVVPLFAVTVFGYAVWWMVALANVGGPGGLLQLTLQTLTLQGGSQVLRREVFTSVSGITTLTQVGILYATVEAFLWRLDRSRHRGALVRASVIGVLALCRVVLNSERLALIEIVLPVVVVMLGRPGGLPGRRIGGIAPLLGLPALFSLFAVGEYFRSWANFYQARYSGPYLQFAAERLLGYYTTALNNAAIYVEFQETQMMNRTVTSLLRFPGTGGSISSLYDRLFRAPETLTNQQLLQEYGNPEFNNVALLGQLHNDFTILGMGLAAAIIGLVTISLYRSFKHGQIIGMLLYPTWFIGIVDVSRTYYWINQRYFPVLLFALITLALFHTRSERSSTRSVQSVRPQSAMRSSR